MQIHSTRSVGKRCLGKGNKIQIAKGTVTASFTLNLFLHNYHLDTNPRGTHGGRGQGNLPAHCGMQEVRTWGIGAGRAHSLDLMNPS